MCQISNVKLHLHLRERLSALYVVDIADQSERWCGKNNQSYKLF